MCWDKAELGSQPLAPLPQSKIRGEPKQFRAEIQGVAVIVKFGDLLTESDADALVNAANERLVPGGGVCGALHAAAGPGLAEECATFAAENGPLDVGGATITTGGALPVPWIIHAVGPIFGREDARLLETAYRSALMVAEVAEVATVAFPLLSSGIYGFPVDSALVHALRGIRDHLADGHATTLREVRLVLRDPAHRPAARAAFGRTFPGMASRTASSTRRVGTAPGAGGSPCTSR